MRSFVASLVVGGCLMATASSASEFRLDDETLDQVTAGATIEERRNLLLGTAAIAIAGAITEKFAADTGGNAATDPSLGPIVGFLTTFGQSLLPPPPPPPENGDVNGFEPFTLQSSFDTGVASDILPVGLN